jgi:predicted CXXCH cytochrome family protein
MTRKYITLFFLLAGLAIATNASAQFSHIKNIVGSAHDLSITGAGPVKAAQGGIYGTQVCFYCHTPHPSSSAPNQPPLWNHTLSTVSTYGVYSSPTFDAVVPSTNIADLGLTNVTTGGATVSNLCLSCHDATIAPNSTYGKIYGSETYGTTTVTSGVPDAGLGPGVLVPVISVSHDVISNLAKVHPVNFTYDATLAGKVTGLAVPTQTLLGSAGSLAGLMYVVTASTANGGALPLFPTPGLTAVAPKMQCATCHDVHDNTTNSPFLRDSLTGSQLCLDCHGAS